MEEQLNLLKEIITRQRYIGYEYNYTDLVPMHSLSNHFLTYVKPLHERIQEEFNDSIKFLSITNDFISSIIEKGSSDSNSYFINFIKAFTEQWAIEARDTLGTKHLLKNINVFSTEYLDKYKLEELSTYFEKVFYDEEFREKEMEYLDYENVDFFLNETYKRYFKELENIYNEAKINIDKIYDFLKDNKIIAPSLAEQYHKYYKIDTNDSLTNFIKNKKISEECEFEIKMSKSQGIQKVSIFKDGSFLIKDSDENDWTPKFDSENYIEISKEIALKYLDYFLRKKPKIKNIFIEQLIKENYDIVGAYKAAKNYMQYENILKNEKIDITKLFEKENVSFEKIDDLIHTKIYENKVKKLASSIISKKYAHLYNEQSYKIFKLLYDLKVTKEDLENNIGTKLAGFKKPENLNQALSRYYNSLNEFDMNSIIKKASKFDVDVAIKENDYLILKINDYEASNSLGSGSWCISRDSHYFENYTRNDNQQFFIYDFSKNAEDNDSMIGITLTRNGDVHSAHYKNDFHINNEKFKKEIANKIIEKNPEWFQLSAAKTNKIRL